MTVGIADDDENAKAVLAEADRILSNEQETVQIESIFKLAAKVGAMLVIWRKMMVDGQFSTDWTEEAAMKIFDKYFGNLYEFDEDDDR